MESSAKEKPKTKLDIKINYAGREHPFHPEEHDLVGIVREEAMTFFEIVADRDRLRLYRADNTELNDGTEIGSYGLAKHDVLLLRQPTGGGS